MSADAPEETVRRANPEAYLASLFAPAGVREALWALHAFDAELARIALTVSESVIGEMRLAWARDAVSDLFADPPRVRRHPVYEALAGLRSMPGAPDEKSLITLVEARNADLGEGAFPDAAERERYADRSAGLVIRLAARLCAPDWQPDGKAETALTAAGRLVACAGMLRDFARLSASGRPPVTQDELAASGAGLEALRRGLQPDAALRARAGLMNAARTAAAALDATRKSLPSQVFPALGHVTLARGTLKASHRQRDPYAPLADTPDLVRQGRLLGASLTGRI